MAHYVIVGGGRVGSRLAATLDVAGHSVAVVDRDARAEDGLPADFSGEFVAGIGFDRDVLRRAGIEKAQGLAAVTADDGTNIIAARVARETFHVDHVVARIYDAERARVYQRLGVPTVASIQWTAEQVLHRLLPAGAADAEQRDPSGRLIITELVPHPSWWGRRLAEVESMTGIRVAYLTRFGEGMLPAGVERLQEGDVVHGVYPVDRRDAVEAALQGKAREPDEDEEERS
ncbi:TrkA family potassium uptake protein [Micrococcus sp. M4NT]|uniref:potassium channel family protein n=1 Tax=Micrococcus sp. M4NT TaxID=2957501 RepID=UPI0029A50B75|nr:TrkA family potassium uptake protein [Micrococcus sp. M4NT]MDX2341875.1 TrkA family potassium uptake protein [Micrococcus sp. M4NT]